jgi:hypothetical protein
VSDGKKDDQKVQKKTLGQALLGIFIVLRNLRFVFFLVVIGLFWFLYVQLYNLVPLFLRHIDPNAPVELYTLANPVMIVCFQLLITRMVKKWTPVKSIILGAAVMTCGMLINVIPPLFFKELSQKINVLGLAIPIAGIFLIIAIASMAGTVDAAYVAARAEHVGMGFIGGYSVDPPTIAASRRMADAGRCEFLPGDPVAELKRQADQAGETRFYYTGMAQASLLDRLMPDWKVRILAKGVWLEDLLQSAVQQP